ncbi:MAG: hypothetical protein ACI94Y_000374 [Maribacter sp.]|jgi:hypothetical protein
MIYKKYVLRSKKVLGELFTNSLSQVKKQLLSDIEKMTITN